MQQTPKDKKPDEVKVDRALLKNEYIGPDGYAFGKTAGAVFVVGTAIFALYYAAFSVFGKGGQKVLLKPYDWYLKVKNPVWGWTVENVIGRIPAKPFQEYAQHWTPKGVPQEINDHTKFLIASTIGALVGKIVSIPSYFGYKREAEAINQRTAKRNATIKEQENLIQEQGAAIDQFEARLASREKSAPAFADRERKPGASFTERALEAPESAAEHAV